MSFIIVDPSLKSTSGHHYRFGSELINEFKSKNVDFKIIGNRHSNLDGQLPELIKYFNYGIYDDHLRSRLVSLLIKNIEIARKYIKAIKYLFYVFFSVRKIYVKIFHKVIFNNVFRKLLKLTIFPVYLVKKVLNINLYHKNNFFKYSGNKYNFSKLIDKSLIKDEDTIVVHTATLDMFVELNVACIKAGITVSAIWIFHFHPEEFCYLTSIKSGKLKNIVRNFDLKNNHFFAQTNLLKKLYKEYTGIEMSWLPELRRKNTLPSGEYFGRKYIYIPGVMRLDKNLEYIFEIIEIIQPVLISENCFLVMQIDRDEFKKINWKFKKYKKIVKIIIDDLSEELFEDTFSNAELIFCPYKAVDYKYKRSGAYTEASFFNKKIIFPENSSMKFDRYKAQLYEFKDLNDLNQILLGALTEVQIEFEPRNDAYEENSVFSKSLIKTIFKKVETGRRRKIAHILRADWINCGSNNTMIFQERALQKLGYAVFTHFFADKRHEDANSRGEEIYNKSESSALMYTYNQPEFNIKLIYHSLFQRIKYGPLTPLNLMSLRITSSDVSRNLTNLQIKANDKTLVLSNHYFTLTMAEKIANKLNAHLICDMHDIWSESITLGFSDFFKNNNNINYNKMLDFEIDMYKKADSVISITKESSVLLNENKINHRYITAPVNLNRRRNQANYLRREFVIFASDNMPNRRSYTMFINLYAQSRRLRGEGITIKVCGGISDYVANNFSHVNGLNIVGTVDDVYDIYNGENIILLPEISGTGVSVRFAQCIQTATPMICSPSILRDSEISLPNLFLAKSENDWVQAILLAKNNSEEWKIAKERYLESVKNINYDRRWEEKFSGIIESFENMKNTIH